MVLSHVAPSTRVAALAHFPLWLSAAEPFILISGTVLGMRAARRMRQAAPAVVYRHVWRRAAILWATHCVLMFAVVLVHEATGRLNVASVAGIGGWLSALWMVPTLRLQSTDYMNILPLYVVFLALVPLGLEAFRRGWTLGWLGLSLLVWALAQRDPGVLPLVHPASGEIIFSVAAWQLVFMLGLAVGYHRDGWVSELWRRRRGWLFPLCALSTGALFVLAQLQRSSFARLGLSLRPEWSWLFAKVTWGPGRAAYGVGFLFLAYLGLRRVVRPDALAPSAPRRFAEGAVIRPLEMFGRKSLYCFVMHLLFALTASAFSLESYPGWMQETLAVASVVALYAAARRDVLARWVPR